MDITTDTSASDITSGNPVLYDYNYEGGYHQYINKTLFNHSLIFVVLFGVSGNVMAFLIFAQKTFKESVTGFLFRMLALCETLFLIAELSFALIELYGGIETVETTNLGCHIWNQLSYTFRDISAWILTFISVERFIGVTFPHKVKTIFTKCFAYVTCGVIAVLMVAKNSFYYFTLETYYDSISNDHLCLDREDMSPGWQKFWDFYSYLDFVVYSGIPFCVILICNIAIITTLARARRLRAQITQHESGGGNGNTLTILLVTVSMTYIILSSPINVYFLFFNDYTRVSLILFHAGLYCQYLNHSVNFYLYLLTGSSFRAELKLFFKCCAKSSTTQKSSNAEGTASTSVKTVSGKDAGPQSA